MPFRVVDGVNVYYSHCWDCGEPYLDEFNNHRCPVCNWLICHVCGACRKNGCFAGTSVKGKAAREHYRDVWLSLEPDERPPADYWVSALVQREQREQRAVEERKLIDVERTLELAKKHGVSHATFGAGTITRVEETERYTYLHVDFPDFSDKVFLFPSCFIDGHLSLLD